MVGLPGTTIEDERVEEEELVDDTELEEDEEPDEEEDVSAVEEDDMIIDKKASRQFLDREMNQNNSPDMTAILTLPILRTSPFLTTFIM